MMGAEAEAELGVDDDDDKCAGLTRVAGAAFSALRGGLDMRETSGESLDDMGGLVADCFWGGRRDRERRGCVSCVVW